MSEGVREVGRKRGREREREREREGGSAMTNLYTTSNSCV